MCIHYQEKQYGIIKPISEVLLELGGSYVPGKIVPSELSPVVLEHPLDGVSARRQHGEPGQRRPQPVLLAHVVRPRAEALLPAEGQPPRVHQVPEVLPPWSKIFNTSGSSRTEISCRADRTAYLAFNAFVPLLSTSMESHLSSSQRKAAPNLGTVRRRQM